MTANLIRVLTPALLLLSCGVRPERDILRTYRLTASRAQLSQPTWLAETTSDELAASLSPNGKRLLYASNSKGQFDIWVKDLTTGLPIRLTKDVAEDTQPAWGPQGNVVAFVSRREDAKGDIYLWDDGKVRRLTDNRSSDEFPAFDAKGMLYFASGTAGRTRIERLDPRGDKRSALTDWNATHPALGPNGRYLAYTWLDRQRRGRIRLKRLSDRSEWTVTTADYHAGFPAFSADGRHLLFCRFVRGAPDAPRDSHAVASLWRVPLQRVVAGDPAAQLIDRAEQLTSNRQGVLLPRAHARGIVLTVQRLEGLDIGLSPHGGLLPASLGGNALAQLARQQSDPWDELFLLRHLRLRSPSHRAPARYRQAQLLTTLGELHKAEQALRILLSEHETTTEAKLARVDQITLPVERARRARQPDLVARRATTALAQLAQARRAATGGRVQAYVLLRQGDMQRLVGQRAAAIGSYERVQQHFSDQRDLAAQARLQAGQLLAAARTPEMLAEYYLTIFNIYPRQTAVLLRAATAALGLWGGSTTEQIAQIRRLLDRHADKRLFCALAAKRLAALYDESGAADLAIRALDRGISRYERTDELTADLASSLGRLSLKVSAKLRTDGRPGEALAFYERALSAYDKLVRHFEPATEVHQRARRAYLRLSLLDAAQQRRQGERAVAKKRYEAIVAFDPELLQAHRGLVQLAVEHQAADTRRQREDGRESTPPPTALSRLEQRYRAHDSRFVRTYMQGYLATFRQPLREADLKQAEQWLQQAIALRPQNPFPHLTLGWVYEMRERYLGQTEHGWLEEAVIAYGRAYELNDSGLDPQTEADLLLNLSNSFAALGSGWDEVLGFCRRRRKLGYPFDSEAQEAVHRLTCGRASSASGDYERAADQLERALQLARRLKKGHLETQTLARLAVNEHLRGDYSRSSRLLERVRARLVARGQKRNLTAIDRTLAYNALLAADYGRVFELIGRANATLRKHGTPAVPQYLAVAPRPLPSTLPLGLERLAEDYALRGLGEIAQQNRRRWDNALTEQGAAVQLQQRRVGARAFDELQRELLIVRNRYALTAARVDRGELFWEQIEAAMAEAAALRAQAAQVDGPTLTLEVGLALNAAEQLLGELDDGHARQLERLAAIHQRLERLDQIDGAAEQGSPISERARLGLWSALAQLSFRLALTQTIDSTSPAPASDRQASGPSTSDPARRSGRSDRPDRPAEALAGLSDRSALLTDALERLERVVEHTAPGTAPEEPVSALSSYGAALMAPLRSPERQRWHVLAALNLARLATPWVEPQQLEQHPTTRRLKRLASAMASEPELGLLSEVLAGELAYRRADRQTLAQATERFVARHPLQLDADQLGGVDQARDWLFGRAVALAIREERAGDALRFAEVAERHAFVVSLVRFGPAGGPKPARQRLTELLARAASYRALSTKEANQPSGSAEATARADQLRQAERRVQQALQELRLEAPTVARLLEVGEFPLDELRAALDEGDALLRTVHDGTNVALVAVTKAEGTRCTRLQLPLGALRDNTDDGRGALAAIDRALSRLRLQVKRFYVDFGAIDPALTDAFRATNGSVVRLATAWELLDARRRRNITVGDRVVVAGSTAWAVGLPQSEQVRQLSKGLLNISRLEQAAEQGGTLVLQRPVRFAGGSPTNLVIALEPTLGDRHDFRPARQLGQPLRTALLILPDVAFGPSPGRRRRQRVALLRLLHAMGVPSVALRTQQASNTALAKSLRALGKEPLADALQAGGLQLFGDSGVAPAERMRLAHEELKRTVFAGARAFNAKPRQLANTIELLESARRYMAFVGEDKFLAGALLYLANAYGLQQDYGRAIRRMKRLVSLRKAALTALEQQSKQAPPKQAPPKQAPPKQAPPKQAPPKQTPRVRVTRLKATAQYVTALRRMAWLRLRNEQYDAALAVNSESITIYRQIGRRGLLRAALALRSVINERKGDYAAALSAAQQSLAIARARAGRSRAKTGAKLVAAAEATRVATLQRLRFSRFDAAMRAVREALAFAAAPGPKATPEERKRLLRSRGDALLELARIQSARGTFADAVDIGERARDLLASAGFDTDTAELEVVNNLYYMGAYQRALSIARRALAQIEDKPRTDKLQRTIQFLNARGTVLAALGRYDASLAALRRALRKAKRQGIAREIAATQNNIGNTERLAGKQRAARRSFNAALAIDQRAGDKLGMSFSLANRGLAQAALGLAAEAEEDLRRASELAQQIGAPLAQLKALAGLARLALEQRRDDLALERAKTGLALASRLGLRNWIWRFSLQSGRAHLGLDNRPAAARAFQAGVRIVEQQPPRPRPIAASGQSEEQPRELYEELIDLQAQTGHAASALELVRRLHARAFSDLSSAEIRQVGDPAVATLLDRHVRLQGAQEASRSALLRPADGSGRTKARTLLQQQGRELEHNRDRVRQINPRLLALVEPEVTPLPQIRSAVSSLGADSAVVIYFATRRQLLIWLLTPGPTPGQGSDNRDQTRRGAASTLQMLSVDVPRVQLRRTVQQVHRHLERYAHLGRPRFELSRWLVEPVLARTKARRLYLLCGGFLRSVPFAALRLKNEPLIARHTIVSLASLADLLPGAASPAGAGGLGSRETDAAALSGRPWVSFSAPGSSIDPLPFSGYESAALGRTFGFVRVFQREEATRQAFRSFAPEAAQLHLATHARLDANSPLRSSLQLSDGLISLGELVGMPFSSRLVLLSACDTGHNPSHGTEGVVGIDRLLLLAGARGVVSSLWRIDDLAAALLMKRLFRLLAQGEEAGSALRLAQLQLREQHPHPAFWAAFRAVGPAFVLHRGKALSRATDRVLH